MCSVTIGPLAYSPKVTPPASRLCHVRAPYALAVLGLIRAKGSLFPLIPEVGLRSECCHGPWKNRLLKCQKPSCHRLPYLIVTVGTECARWEEPGGGWNPK